jgi:hypothetical protein
VIVRGSVFAPPRWDRRCYDLTRAQRTLLAETLRDIANMAAGAMIFGQFLADATFSANVALGGMFLWVLLVLCALLFASEGHS